MFQLAVKILIVGLTLWGFFVLVRWFWKRAYQGKGRPEEDNRG